MKTFNDSNFEDYLEETFNKIYINNKLFKI
jgi:hypothetical protein